MIGRCMIVPLLAAALVLSSCTQRPSAPPARADAETPKVSKVETSTPDYGPGIEASVQRLVKLEYRIKDDPKRRNEADDVFRGADLRESLDTLSREPHVRYVWFVEGEGALTYSSGGPGKVGDDIGKFVPNAKLPRPPLGTVGWGALLRGDPLPDITRFAMTRDRDPNIRVKTWPVVVWIEIGSGKNVGATPRVAVLGVAYDGPRQPGAWRNTAEVAPQQWTALPRCKRRAAQWWGRYSVTVNPVEARSGGTFKATVGYIRKQFGTKRIAPPGADTLTVRVNDSRGTVVYTSPTPRAGIPYPRRRAGEKAPTEMTYSFSIDKPGRYYVRAYGFGQPQTEPVLIEVY